MARKERDRERARAEECFADAEAARRERDRERQKARGAMAAATAAKAGAAEAAARVAGAEAAIDQALAARDQAMAAFDDAVTTGERAVAARDEALAALDEALARITELEAALEATRAERDASVAAEAVVAAQRDEAVDTLAARADGAVVVLPGVALPEAPEAPVEPASRVSWRPTWSEWARNDTEDAAPMVAEGAGPADGTVAADVVSGDVTDHAEANADEIDLDRAEDAGTRRYLNVAATIGQLLPEDLGPLLLSGATVVRREGRLYATVAVTTSPWTPGGSDGALQAQKLAEAGYRVEWTSNVPLAC